jgi:uncharacterized membrane protein
MTDSNPNNSRGFTASEIIFAMAFSLFMIGLIMGQFDNGGLFREISWVVAGCFVVIAIVFALIQWKVESVKNQESHSGQTTLVVLTLVFFVIMMGMITFVHDRQANPPEEYCHNIGSGQHSMSSFERAVVLDTGQCIKNETGFHANGKAIFP